MKLLLPIITSLLFLLLPTVAAAQPTTPAVTTSPDSNSAIQGAPACIRSTFGCIPTNPVELVGLILRVVLGFAGGIAFLMMVYGSIKLITSGGNPDALKEGREFITYAILGMLVIVFSVFILGFIGVKILKIPGLG